MGPVSPDPVLRSGRKPLDRDVRRGDGEVETHLCRHVISSAAITELTAAIEPRPKAYDHAMALRYRDFITVSLIARFRMARMTPAFRTTGSIFTIPR